MEIKCTKCGAFVPEGSRFCRACGAEQVSPVQQEETNQQPVCAVAVEPQAPAKAEAAGKVAKQKKSGRAGAIVAIVLLAILLVGSAGLNVFQYMQAMDAAKTGESQEEEWKEEKDRLEKQGQEQEEGRKEEKEAFEAREQELEEEIEALEADVLALNEKAEAYDAIRQASRSGKLGHAADNFCASAGIIWVDLYETNRKFTLTAHWPDGGTVQTEYSGFSAGVEFDESSWNTSVQMTVVPYEVGVTTVTFDNTVDGETFDVIIVVTDD